MSKQQKIEKLIQDEIFFLYEKVLESTGDDVAIVTARRKEAEKILKMIQEVAD